MDELMSRIGDFIAERIDANLDKLNTHPDYVRGHQQLRQVESEIKNILEDNYVLPLMESIREAASDIAYAHQERAYIQGFKDALNVHKL